MGSLGNINRTQTKTKGALEKVPGKYMVPHFESEKVQEVKENSRRANGTQEKVKRTSSEIISDQTANADNA